MPHLNITAIVHRVTERSCPWEARILEQTVAPQVVILLPFLVAVARKRVVMAEMRCKDL